MLSEIIDIYDENLHKLGQVERDKVHFIGAWHRTIHCWIVRPHEEGFVLFQKRGRKKELFPSKLDITAAGHYSSGESRTDGIREITEELGIVVDYSELRYLGIKFDLARSGSLVNREFCDVYLLQKGDAPQSYRLESSEVEGLVEISIGQGLSLCSGESQVAEANGVEWDSKTNQWSPVRRNVSMSDFAPRIDRYYLKIFLMARLLLRGEKYLAI